MFSVQHKKILKFTTLQPHLVQYESLANSLTDHRGNGSDVLMSLTSYAAIVESATIVNFEALVC